MNKKCNFNNKTQTCTITQVGVHDTSISLTSENDDNVLMTHEVCTTPPLNRRSNEFFSTENNENVDTTFIGNRSISLESQELSISKDDIPKMAYTFYQIGESYIQLKGRTNIQEGLKHLKISLKIYQKLLPECLNQILILLKRLGKGYQVLGTKEDICKALVYYKEIHKINKYQFPENHEAIALGLNNIGNAYQALGGKENISKGLDYQIQSLNMMKKAFSGNHSNIAILLNIIGSAYVSLGFSKGLNDTGIRIGLSYQKQSLKMYQLLQHDKDIARMLHNIAKTYHRLEKHEKEQVYLEKSLEKYRSISTDDHPDVADLLDEIGIIYLYNGYRKIREALIYLKEALEMRQNLFSGNHPDIASSLVNVGCAYQKLGGEKNIRKALMYKELSLKIYLFTENHPRIIAESFWRTGSAYQILGDENKALEYFKQAYSLDSENVAEYEIRRHQMTFFKFLTSNLLDKAKIERRWVIFSRGEFNDDLITIKQKIQKDILNNIFQAVDRYGWSWRILSNLGVKGYIENDYLKRELDELGNNNDNIELAQMLCFEAMNLGIMKLEKKPYEVAENFTREYPELVKKIAKEHPEFFIDGSIVEVCIRAMPDQESKKHIFSHVKYMGMEERRTQGFIDI